MQITSGQEGDGAFTYSSGGASLFVRQAGEGRPVIFYHGGLGDHRAAAPVVGVLAASMRVITPDMRGAGRSVFADALTWGMLSDDVAALIDQLGLSEAMVGGISAGAGVAVRFALDHPHRCKALLLATPGYPGQTQGLAPAQEEAFEMMDAAGKKAAKEGVEAIFPLYERLPEPMRSRALAMAKGFDAASVAATTAFLASGVQPFESPLDLARIACPVVLIPGADAHHPPAVSALYQQHLRRCIVVGQGDDSLASVLAALP